jgi:hypothetical protein
MRAKTSILYDRVRLENWRWEAFSSLEVTSIDRSKLPPSSSIPLMEEYIELEIEPS